MASATGSFKSGMMELWNKEYEDDKNLIKMLSKKSPSTSETYHELSPEGLESKIIEIDAIQIEVDNLISKYNASMNEDLNQINHLREDRRHIKVTR